MEHGRGRVASRAANGYNPAMTTVAPRQALAVCLSALAYGLAFTFGHEMVSQAYGAVFQRLGRAVMEPAAGWAMALSVLALSAFLVRRGRGAWTRARLVSLVTALLLVAASDRLLVSTNVERIHYLQYALLAALLRGAFSSDGLILALCTAVGVLDELWQYAAYPFYTRYFDFNDVVLNQAGAWLGLVLSGGLWSGDGRLSQRVETRVRAWLAWLGAAALAAACLGLALGRVVPFLAVTGRPESVFQDVDGAMVLVLSFLRPGPWEVTDWGRGYHVLLGWEGVAAVAGMLVLHRLVVRPARTAPGSGLSP